MLMLGLFSKLIGKLKDSKDLKHRYVGMLVSSKVDFGQATFDQYLSQQLVKRKSYSENCMPDSKLSR